MMTARKRVGPLPTHHLAMRHSFDYSSSVHFSLDDSLRDSSSSSSSETSSDSSADALSDSASSRSSSDHSLPTPSSGMRPSHHLCSLVPSIPRSSAAISDRPSHSSSFASPSHKRSRSPTASVLLSSPIPRSLSYAYADLLPSPKRIRSPESATDFEVSSAEGSKPSKYRGTDLEMDVDVVRSDGIDIDPEIQAEIDEFIAYADALRDRGIDARVVVEAIDREEIEMGMRGPVEVRVYRVTHLVVADDILEPTQEGAVKVMYETLGDLVQRIVATGQQSADMLERIKELERDNMRRRDMMDVMSQRVTRSHRRKTMPNTRSGASRTHEGINEQIDRQMAGALGAHNAARNLEPLIGDGGNSYNFRRFVPARECTYQDFLKCQPLSFNGTEGVVGLTRWFEKMETVFHISNCPEKYQVKYATCTLLNSALTWWNSHKKTIGIEAAYAMSWAELIKLMTKVYCPRNEVQKIETELWNMVVKGNDLTTYTRRFQELVLLCTRMVPNEEDKFERFVGGYARSAENKRRLENNPRDNRGQQPVFKRQNVRGQNMAIAYTARNNEKKEYVGSPPYCNKCKLHHVGSCTVGCGNCKSVGHITRDYTVIITPNTQRALVGNQPGILCYECGRPRHFRKDCPKLRNQNRGNKTGNKNGNKTENQTRGNEATKKAYAIGGGGANPDSNIVMGMFLLNDFYASMLFDSGADRSFVLSTFSVLLDVAPSTLDTSYAVELADGRILETNVVLRGCTLGLLFHLFDIDLMPVELGSFDVIIGRSKSKLNIISCTKSQKYIQKGCQVYLAQVTSKKTEDKSEEKRLEDVPI
ncbi:putative reverse transcriptase domain-containing protein, partial [Tanacetum coccineum]